MCPRQAPRDGRTDSDNFAMMHIAANPTPDDAAMRLASRGDLTAFLMDLTAKVGANAYMLVAIVHDQDRKSARILASNWIHDAIELVGLRLIAKLAQGPAAAPGERPRSLRATDAPDLPGVIDREEATLLDVLGHCELYSLGIQAGRHRYFLLLSCEHTDRMDGEALVGAQMLCGYALSQIPGLLRETVTQSALSERERECLMWVSDGKTTEEVALILGVSGNTVNGYVTNAIQKLSSSNRAMAVATAIRGGII